MQLSVNVATQQRQSMSITAQVIQSIKLLQYGQEELREFLQDQAERNPLIDIVSGVEAAARQAQAAEAARLAADPAAARERARAERARTAGPASDRSMGGAGLRGGNARPGEGGAPNLEDYCACVVSLREHLQGQVAIAFRTPADRALASEIVESLDPDGYLRRDLDEIADFLGAEEARVELVLGVVQTFDPTGVGARDLAECLRLQLQERGRFTPAMQALLANLKLLAGYNLPQLSRLCGVTEAEIVAMAREIRELDPRPGRRFDSEPLLPALPDVRVELRPDGDFSIELNPSLLPRVLIDRQYHARVTSNALGQQDARFVSDCMRNASWLSRNLHQRAQTILKVATELVAQQRDFLLHGVEHLKPLCLRDVAKAVGLHESTVCRAIANKYVMTDRGMFELKFFFASAIASAESEEDFAAETIRHKIRKLVAAETVHSVLSDDAIMAELRKDGAEIARRTVAKYREMMGIPSSLRRRRRKQAELIVEDPRACVSA